MIKNNKLGYRKHVLDEFEFENGAILQNVEVEYTTRGTPKYDDNGNITNAILYCHRFHGNCLSIEDLHQLIGDRSMLADYNFFYISITSLGYPESCSPSTTHLKYDFPKYSIKDSVDFKRKFLKDVFNINKILGIVGIEIGGFEAYTWACEYPDEMEFIIIGSSSFKTDGYRYITSKALNNIIELSSAYHSEVYSESLSKLMFSINSLIYPQFYSRRALQNFTLEELDIFMEEFVEENSFADIYDFKYMNNAIMNYNLEDKISNIKAKTLIANPSADIYFVPEFDVYPLKEKIENIEIYIFDDLEFVYNYDYSIFVDVFREFLKEFKK